MTWLVYHYTWCPFCKAALKILKDKNQKVKKIDIEKIGGKDRVIKSLKKLNLLPEKSKHNTVPIIFKNYKFIGGLRELKKLYK
jgi:glutaredoxin